MIEAQLADRVVQALIAGSPGSSTGGSTWFAVVYVVVLVGGFGGWFAYRVRRRGRRRRLIARARAVALVDADFSEQAVMDACAPGIARLTASHDYSGLAVLQELVGASGPTWVSERSRIPVNFRAEVTSCDVVRVLDRGEEGTRRVVVCLTASVSIPSPVRDRRRSWMVFWTFSDAGGQWNRTAVEDEWTGRRHLDHDPLEAPPVDLQRLHDRAVMQEADERVDPTELLASVGDLLGGRDTTRALNDLAVIDERYAPVVIESCVHRVLGAWELATNGSPSALEGVAIESAAEGLLHPKHGPSVVREPRLAKLKFVELDASSVPPSVTVLATINIEPDIYNVGVYWRFALSDASTMPWILNDARAWTERYRWVRE